MSKSIYTVEVKRVREDHLRIDVLAESADAAFEEVAAMDKGYMNTTFCLRTADILRDERFEVGAVNPVK